jgi:Asp-tRNA(Asn)/Glu-tRNA(Gln) amidotransferase A subunit family amidase
MQSFIAIRDRIAAGTLDPRAAVETSLDAIDARDGDIRAFAARAGRTALLDGVALTGPLAGMAVGVKDIFDTHDLETTYGSAIYAGHRPVADAALVAMMRRAGASIAGKTVTTEFAHFQPGPTRNPHDPSRTPGGSSSGSAAAVAAGMVPGAIGTQTAGSISRPASFCGIAGYKPSFRLVPLVGAKTFSWSLDSAGFFAATVADVAAFASAATGRALEAGPVDPTSLRIGLYRDALWEDADADMRRAVEAMADRAAALGARVVEIDAPGEFEAAREAQPIIQDYEAALALGGEFDRYPDRLSATLRDAIAAARTIKPAVYDRARRAARHGRRAANELFAETVDAILTPAAPGAAPAGLASTGSPAFNRLWTLLGTPAIAIPGARNGAGLPLGVQLVAGFARDQRALSIAAWLEKA